MRVLYLLIISVFIISCTSNEEAKAKTKEPERKKINSPKIDAAKEKYNWEELVLSTDYVQAIPELSEFQKDQLELIKYNFSKIEKSAFDEASDVYQTYYKDSISKDSLYLTGVHIFNDATEVIEFYFESQNTDRPLISIVLFQKFKLLGTTYID